MAIDKITSEHTATILKELSDIKTSLAVNTNETANIKGTVSKIETTVNAIQNDFVSRREFGVALKELAERTTSQFQTSNDKISFLNKALWGVVTTVFLSIAVLFFKLIFK